MPDAALLDPDAALLARLRVEHAILRAVNAAMATFLREVRREAMAALAGPVLLAAAPPEPFTLGTVDRHYTTMSAKVVDAVSKVNATADYRRALEARLRADPLPTATFDAVRALLLMAKKEGWAQRKVRSEMSKTLAIGQRHAERIARTEATAAYAVSVQQDIVATPDLSGKQWVSAGDAKVRPTHAEADGQVVPQGATFSVGAEALAFPGDPNGSAEETANCRCTMVGATLDADEAADTG